MEEAMTECLQRENLLRSDGSMKVAQLMQTDRNLCDLGVERYGTGQHYQTPTSLPVRATRRRALDSGSVSQDGCSSPRVPRASYDALHRERDDLQQQLETASRRLLSTRSFVEEQAAEREAERDEFARRLDAMRNENNRLAARLQTNAPILNENMEEAMTECLQRENLLRSDGSMKVAQLMQTDRNLCDLGVERYGTGQHYQTPTSRPVRAPRRRALDSGFLSLDGCSSPRVPRASYDALHRQRDDFQRQNMEEAMTECLQRENLLRSDGSMKVAQLMQTDRNSCDLVLEGYGSGRHYQTPTSHPVRAPRRRALVSGSVSLDGCSSPRVPRASYDALHRERDDLQQQLETASRRLCSTRSFVEEQAAEREAERDEFVRRLDAMRDENNRLAARLRTNATILNEVEQLEAQTREMNTLIQDLEARKAAADEELKANNEKISLLRDIIANLEIQLKQKTAHEAVLLEQRQQRLSEVEQLEAQTREMNTLIQDLEARKAAADEELKANNAKISLLRDIIANLEYKLDRKTAHEAFILEQVEQLEAQTREMNTLIQDLEARKAAADEKLEANNEKISLLRDIITNLENQLEQKTAHEAVILEQGRWLEEKLHRRTRRLERVYETCSATCSESSEDVSLRHRQGPREMRGDVRGGDAAHALPGAAPRAAPHALPGAAPRAAPHALSGAAPRAAQHALPGAAPRAAPHALPGAAPRAAPHALPGAAPRAAQHALPGAAPRAAQHALSGAARRAAPHALSGAAPRAAQHAFPGAAPRAAPHALPGAAPRAAPHAAPPALRRRRPAPAPRPRLHPAISRRRGDVSPRWPAMPELFGVFEAVEALSRAEDAALKRIGDLDMQRAQLTDVAQEVRAERDVLQARMSEQALKISSLSARLETQRNNAEALAQQAAHQLTVSLHDALVETEIESHKTELAREITNPRVLVTSPELSAQRDARQELSSRVDSLQAEMRSTNQKTEKRDQAIRYLYIRCFKLHTCRKALAWQKRYLQMVVARYELERSLRLTRAPEPSTGKKRFKCVATCVVVVSRMRFLVRRRAQLSSLSAAAILLESSPQPADRASTPAGAGVGGGRGACSTPSGSCTPTRIKTEIESHKTELAREITNPRVLVTSPGLSAQRDVMQELALRVDSFLAELRSTNQGTEKRDQAVRYLHSRFLKLEYFRKALGWQKRYLHMVVARYELDRSLRLTRAPEPSTGKKRFKCVVTCVVVTLRMRFLVRRRAELRTQLFPPSASAVQRPRHDHDYTPSSPQPADRASTPAGAGVGGGRGACSTPSGSCTPTRIKWVASSDGPTVPVHNMKIP